MQYHILGKTVEIYAMQQSSHLSKGVFEFQGNKALEEIGLREKFYFKAPDRFSLDPSLASEGKASQKGVYQRLLGLYLQKSIHYGQLVHQWTL